MSDAFQDMNGVQVGVLPIDEGQVILLVGESMVVGTYIDALQLASALVRASAESAQGLDVNERVWHRAFVAALKGQ